MTKKEKRPGTCDVCARTRCVARKYGLICANFVEMPAKAKCRACGAAIKPGENYAAINGLILCKNCMGNAAQAQAQPQAPPQPQPQAQAPPQAQAHVQKRAPPAALVRSGSQAPARVRTGDDFDPVAALAANTVVGEREGLDDVPKKPSKRAKA